MTILDDFGKALTRTSQDVAKRAKDIAEKGNLKIQLKEEIWKLSEEYSKLGEKYFALFGENVPAELREEAAKVEELKRKINILEEHLSKLGNEKQCPNCGTRMSAKGPYCSACGEKYPEPEETEEEAEEVEFHACGGCGNQVMEGEAYCTKCGMKQEDKQEVPKEEEVADVVEEPEVKEAAEPQEEQNN